MKSISVALVTRNSPRTLDKRMVGWFSYPVPGIRWRHYPVNKGAVIVKNHLADEHDLIFYEDAKLDITFTGSDAIPVFYHVVDCFLDKAHHLHRLVEARKADYIIMEQDDPAKFEHIGKPVKRFGYAVNDRFFKDYGLKRDIDVSFYCRTKRANNRAKIQDQLRDHCDKRGYVFDTGTKFWDEYARGFARSKITVNLNNITMDPYRPHRIYDAMACGACVLTDHIPHIPEDGGVDGVHYLTYNSGDHLCALVDNILESDAWKIYADTGYRMVHQQMAWKQKAKQLRSIFMQYLVNVWPRR